MEWRRMKTIVILLLVVVNGFLLIVVGARMSETRRYEQSALEQAVGVLESNGIRVERDGLKAADGLGAMTAGRSIAREQSVAAILLSGETEGMNQGAGLYIYQREGGSVSFRSGGQIYARLADSQRWHTSDPESLVMGLFRELGLEGRIVSTEVEQGSGTIRLCQLRDGVALFSCQMIFSFSEGRLTTISGVLVLDEPVGSEAETLLTLPTALLRFMERILSSGDICSRLETMEPGYRLAQSFGGVQLLRPVWLVSTNAADYYVDAVTGEVSRISGE